VFSLSPYICKMSTKKLLGENEISTNLNSSEKLFTNPISKYNYFVNTYNDEINRVDGIQFKKIENSILYKPFFLLINNGFGKLFLFFALLVIPLLNIFIFISILICVFSYNDGIKIYKKNQQLVNDPFKNMVYAAELCQGLNRNDYFFRIDMNGKLILLKFMNISLLI
jgi:hypothetical protein